MVNVSRFSADVWTLGILVSLAGCLHPDYNFRWVLDYLRDSLVRELDFELEAENMRKCALDLSDLSFVIVPKVSRASVSLMFSLPAPCSLQNKPLLDISQIGS